MAEELEEGDSLVGGNNIDPSLHMGVEYHRGRIRASDDIIMQQSNLKEMRKNSFNCSKFNQKAA